MTNPYLSDFLDAAKMAMINTSPTAIYKSIKIVNQGKGTK